MAVRSSSFVTVAIVVTTLTGGTVPASAARFCKDGYVTYSGGQPSATRSAAERSAVRAWRLSTKDRYGGLDPKPGGSVLSCVQDRQSGTWRCFVRAGLCKAA
jgi:hypothetical protein